MRGHLGFRIPRAPFLETRITQLAVDGLEYIDQTQPTVAVTQMLVDELEYFDQTQNAVKITQYSLDFLQCLAQQNEPRVTKLTLDVLTYTQP